MNLKMFEFQLDLNLKQEEGDVTSFITNGEWDLIRTYLFTHHGIKKQNALMTFQ